VVLEVPAVADGVLVEVKVEAGATVTAGDVLGYLEEGATAQADDAAAADEAESQPAAAADAGDSAAVASPAAQKLMAENDIAASALSGSGKDGRITKADVQAAIDQRGADQSAPAPAAAPAQPAAAT